ncbi:MAG: hypothetical protein O3B42_06970 [Actinomycetota bacterium]|nr:hypothetical protein [Actinomycetota bacterium]
MPVETKIGAEPTSREPGPSTTLWLGRAIMFGGFFLPLTVMGSLALAVVGWFNWATILTTLCLSTVAALWACLRQGLVELNVPSIIGTAGIAGVIVLFVAVNGVFAAEHVFNDRDPGVYFNTTQWIKTHGNLLIDAAGEPFPDAADLTASWLGFHDERTDGRVYAQFSHGSPALGAVVGTFGGTTATRWLNPVLGGIVLATLFVLVLQITRQWAALLLSFVVSQNLSFYYFFRDTYSEPLMFTLVMLAILSCVIAWTSSESVGVYAAALSVGAVAAVRLDAWLFVNGFLILLATWLVLPSRPRLRTRSLAAAAAVCLVASAVGVTDLVLRSPRYVSNLSSQVRQLSALTLVTIILLSAAFLLRHTIRAWIQAAQGSRWPTWRRATGVAVVGVGLLMLLVRPVLFTVRSGYDQATADLFEGSGLDPDGTRTLAELSLQWFAWYWGYVPVIAAIVGIGILVGRGAARWTAGGMSLVFVVVAMMLYLWRPSIYPDHIWAMRRFLVPGTIVMMVGLAVFSDWLIRSLRQQELSRMAKRAAFAVSVFSLVVGTLAVSPNLHGFSRQSGMLAATSELCEDLPSRAAVIVTGELLGSLYAPAVRTFCDVPVASMLAQPTSFRLIEIAEHVAADGFVLVVLSDGSSRGLGPTISEGAIGYPITGAPILNPPRQILYRQHTWLAEVIEAG